MAGHYLDPLDAGEGQKSLQFLLVCFCLFFCFPKVAPTLFQFFIIFGSNFGSLFGGLGVLWVSFGSLLGPLDSLLGGPKNEKMVNVPRENHFFENAVF